MDLDYYTKLEKKVNDNHTEKNGKKSFTFLANDETRRGSFRRRAKAVVDQLREIEVQHHAEVQIIITPRQKNGKPGMPVSYKSGAGSDDHAKYMARFYPDKVKNLQF